jgi:hypothetical protein
MSDNDSLADRRRIAEEDYFKKKDRELIEKMRQSAETGKLRREMSAAIGISDPELLDQLRELGFTPETVSLLPLVPALRVAWAEGGVSAKEREMILEIARARGIDAGSPADAQLETWLDVRPADAVFTGAQRLIAALLDTGTSTLPISVDDVLAQSEQIAAASGGVFGFRSISTEERKLLEQLQKELR